MAVLRGAAGWIIRQAAAMQAAAGVRRWRACPPRWRRWRLRWRCEVWQAVGAVQVGQGWRWCVVIVCGGLLLAWSSGAALAVLILPGSGGRRCDLLRLRGAGVVIVATAAQRPARAGLLIRQAGQVAGGKARQKKKARAAAHHAPPPWPSVCAGGAICCAGCVPVHIVGGGDLLPVPVPGCWRWHRSGRNGSGWQRSSVARPALAVLHPVRFCRLPEGSDSPLYRVVPYV